MITKTRCFWVSKDDQENVVRRHVEVDVEALAADHVRIRVSYSSLNYKDALAATGHPGVARQLPIIPGIDAAGTVLDGGDTNFRSGQEVMVVHPLFGTEVNGGYSEVVQVPSSWVRPLPEQLSARDAMAIGTAGFTAAQSVVELERHSIKPDDGPIVVSGATGGVGSCAVKLLSRLGFEVFAVTGKQEQAEWLKNLGASEVIGRSEVNDLTNRPLLSARWAGAIDTVGGGVLTTILRSAKPYSCVTACGLVGGTDLRLTVYPFILRGVTLQGIDAANISEARRGAIWSRIAGDLSFGDLSPLISEIDSNGLDDAIETMLAGKTRGRVVIKM
ncbi:MAG: YhdH/YhfP family quinone oxidoreductase [Mariniblastus sp.]|nr:YhdH/YhfP family quinone oxidoreductase [Mariniblastus sp.]